MVVCYPSTARTASVFSARQLNRSLPSLRRCGRAAPTIPEPRTPGRRTMSICSLEANDAVYYEIPAWRAHTLLGWRC